jgi:hypothetical protein
MTVRPEDQGKGPRRVPSRGPFAFVRPSQPISFSSISIRPKSMLLG